MCHLKDLKIFIVDDDKFYLNILKQTVQNLGCENVTIFNEGATCLNQLNQKPDVVLLDYNMDTLTGYEVLKKIKRFDPNIYVVMVSGQEEVKPAVDSLKHGAFDYLQKGKNEGEKIKQVLEKIIEVKEILRKSKPSFFRTILKFL